MHLSPRPASPVLRRRVAASLLAVGLSVALVACGSSDDDGDDGTTVQGAVEVTATPDASDAKKTGKKGDKKGATSAATTTRVPKPYVPGNQDGSCPDDHPVKVVNDRTRGGKIHALPGDPQYDVIRAGFCFKTPEEAIAQGFVRFLG